MTGTLYGIGVGPGDPELITVKGLRLLREAPVLAYPAPETGDSLARAIVAGYLNGAKTEIAIRMPMVAARFPAQAVYDEAVRYSKTRIMFDRPIARFQLVQNKLVWMCNEITKAQVLDLTSV